MLDSMEVVFAPHPSVVDTVRMLKERHASLWSAFEVQEEFRLFKDQEAIRLDDDFRKQHGNFRTTVQGVKIRGVYDTVDEARERALKLKAIDGKFNVFVAEVGCWVPWDPSASTLQDVEYAETHLNTLMKKYNEQADIRDEVYANRKDRKIDEMDKDREIWLDNARRQRQEEADAKAKAEADAKQEKEETEETAEEEKETAEEEKEIAEEEKETEEAEETAEEAEEAEEAKEAASTAPSHVQASISTAREGLGMLAGWRGEGPRSAEWLEPAPAGRARASAQGTGGAGSVSPAAPASRGEGRE